MALIGNRIAGPEPGKCAILRRTMSTADAAPRGIHLKAKSQSRCRWHGLGLIVLAFVALTTAWNLLIPPYENLDELEHAEVVRHIAVTGRLPVHDQAEAQGFHVRQEASQPPLYHILAAGWSRLLSLPTTPHNPSLVPGDVVACGPAATFYNKATWKHEPFARDAMWRGASLTLHGQRAFSTLLQVITLIGVWTLARRISTDGTVAELATILVAFNPQFQLVAAGVNNDNAVIPLATWGLVVGFDLWDRGPTWRRSLLFGVLSGLAALSKLSGLGLVGVGGLALLVRIIERRTTFRDAVAHGLMIVLPAALLVSPWLLRNIRLYGDPTALAPMLAKVGTRGTVIALGEARLMLLSYWGQLPCSFYPRALYWPYLLLMAAGLIGLVTGRRPMPRRHRAMMALCAIWFIVIVAAWMRWDMMTAATGGRLLFPAIAAMAILLAAGWNAISPRLVRIWAALLPVWALIVLVAGPMTMLAPPALMPATTIPPNPMSASFAGEVTLRGYAAEIIRPRAACLLVSAAHCAPTLDLTLYWQAAEPIAGDLTMVIQLVSPAPGATDLRLNYNHWPGRGNLPTSAWPVGPMIRDHTRLPLPPTAAATQAWRLDIAFVDPATGERVPVTVDGKDASGSLTLKLLRVPDRQPAPLDGNQLAAPVSFTVAGAPRPAIILQAATTTRDADGNWVVAVLWESVATIDADVVTFVHAYDGNGELLGAGDGPPQRGAFPPHLWEPGDRIAGAHTITLDPETHPAQIAVGLYVPTSGERLTATRDDAPVLNNAVVVWAGEH